MQAERVEQLKRLFAYDRMYGEGRRDVSFVDRDPEAVIDMLIGVMNECYRSERGGWMTGAWMIENLMIDTKAELGLLGVKPRRKKVGK